jgi:ribosomal protein S18 acetylase RimI-like enzyme
MSEIEIRRIREDEGDAVAALWDAVARAIPDGGPLTERGRRNIGRMLSASAWHHAAFCLVAVDDGAIVGFANGRVDPGDGLLPSLAGEIETVHVESSHRHAGLGERLARAAIAHLRERDVWTIRNLVCAGDHDAQRFWARLGFEPDMVCLSLYHDG